MHAPSSAGVSPGCGRSRLRARTWRERSKEAGERIVQGSQILRTTQTSASTWLFPLPPIMPTQ